MEKAYATWPHLGTAKATRVLKAFLLLGKRRTAFLTHSDAATILVTLRGAARRAAESETHAHPSFGPGDRDCIPVGRDGAGRLLPWKTARRPRLFSGRPNGPVVGPGIFDCRNGDLDTHHYRHAGAGLLRQHDISPVGVRLSGRAIPDRLNFSARIFSR